MTRIQFNLGRIEGIKKRSGRTGNGSTKALERTDLTGTFHQKIGSVNGATVDQVQFSNINWSMTVLPEVS